MPSLYGLNFKNLRSSTAKTLTILIITGALLSLAALSCSDDPSTGPDLPDPDPDPDPVSACEAIQLQSTSADPLSLLTVTGLSEEFGESPAGFITANDHQTPIILYRDEDPNHASFTLPPHPSGNLNGGTAEITFISSDAELECPGFEITVNPLEESPGEMDRYTSAFQSGLEELIQHLGYSQDELVNHSIEEMDPRLAPLAIAYKLMSPDHYENNLNAILDGSAPILEGESVTEQQRQLLDALIANSDLVSLTESFFEGLIASGSAAKKSPIPPSSGQFKSVNTSSATVEIVTPSELSELMKMGDYLSGFPDLNNMNPEFPNLFTATHSLTVGIYGDILTAGSETSNPALTGTLSASLSVIQYSLRFILPDLLPSGSMEVELNASPLEFNEDSDEIGEWFAEFSAESQGHSVNTAQFTSQLPVDLWDDIPVIHDMITNINQQFQNALGNIGVNLLGIAANDHLEFLSNTWIVHLDTERDDESDYFNWELIHIDSWDDNPAFEFYTDPAQNIKPEMGYAPVNEGTAELRIQTVGEQFGLPFDPEESIELNVLPIEVVISPNTVVIYLEEAEAEDFDIDVQANVLNADDEQLEWTTDSNQAFFDINDSNGHDVTFYVPEEIGTYTAIAEAITNTGARSDRNPPRGDTLMVQVVDQEAGLVIHPEPGCVTIEDQFAFSASYENETIPIQDVTWELEGPGQIDPDGTFNPSDEGFISILFMYDAPESDETFTTTVEFPVLESCGEFSVESDYFTYFTGCVSADGPNDGLALPFDISTISAAGWTSMGGADMILNMGTDIRDEGEWTRTFRRPSTMPEGSWSVPTFYDHHEDLWVPTDDGVDSESEIFTLERIEITLDGEIIPLFSGSFQLLMYNESEFEREDLYWDEKTESVVNGEFHGIPLVSGINICE